MSSAWRAGGGRLRSRRGSIVFAAARWAATIRDVGRVGKRVVVHLDSGDAIVLEPRMTGLVLVADPPSREHLRFRCTLSGNGIGELLYWDRRGLGSVRLFSPKEFESAFGPEKLGPDALVDDGRVVSRAAWRQQAGGEGGTAGPAGGGRHRQSVRVGDSAPGRHSSGQALRQDHARPMAAIADATHEVLEAAIRYEGSTLGDGTYRNALNQAGGYQNHHRVYDRAGQAVPALRAGSADRAHRAGPAIDVFLSGVSAEKRMTSIARRLHTCGTLHSRRGFALMMADARPLLNSIGWEERTCHGIAQQAANACKATKRIVRVRVLSTEPHDERRHAAARVPDRHGGRRAGRERDWRRVAGRASVGAGESGGRGGGRSGRRPSRS